MNDQVSDAVASAAPSALRLRLRRLFAIFVGVQVIGAAIVTLNAKLRRAARESRRPDDYPWSRLEPVPAADGVDDTVLYMKGTELLTDLIADIDAATKFVHVETFIWNDDESGQVVRDALERAADRGVSIRVMYDGVGSINLPSDFFSANIESFSFKEIRLHPSLLRPRNLIRDHRKLVVIDNQIAYLGGFNFGDLYMSWRDTHMRVEGPSVLDLANAFADFWNQHRPTGTTGIANVDGRPWDPRLTVHRNDPSLGIFPIRGMYMEAIDRAQKRIWITNAYFIPDRAFRRALLDAARRGVDVQVILPQFSNHPLTDILAHGTWEELLAAGVRVFLYRHFMVHAKTCTIDGAWTTVGTANLDRWSMLGNYEINVEVRSEHVAARMERLFMLDKENCLEVDAELWERRPALQKLGERTLRSLSPLL